MVVGRGRKGRYLSLNWCPSYYTDIRFVLFHLPGDSGEVGEENIVWPKAIYHVSDIM